MAFKVCCATIAALVLTLNCNIYAIPLSDLLKTEKTSSTESQSSEYESSENTTVNGTKKDL